jgi:hypothetical protein
MTQINAMRVCAFAPNTETNDATQRTPFRGCGCVCIGGGS